jgi:23S rRNA pseudouridine1911/1915/1917 synthase
MKTEDLSVVYEDNHLIVVVKEANIPSQEDETKDEDLLNIVKAYIKKKYHKPGDAFLGLVHRLDRRVGGLMVFARTSKAASRLSETIRLHQFKKEYLALVLGVTPKSGRLVDYLSKVEKNGPKAVVTTAENNGQEAILEYETLRTVEFEKREFSLVRVNLITGRYNQIRVQFSHFQHPIINDFKYGYQGTNFNDQLGLVCSALRFPHPTTKEDLEFNFVPTDGIWNGLWEKNYD